LFKNFFFKNCPECCSWVPSMRGNSLALEYSLFRAQTSKTLSGCTKTPDGTQGHQQCLQQQLAPRHTRWQVFQQDPSARVMKHPALLVDL
jgi:hypothetical protein